MLIGTATEMDDVRKMARILASTILSAQDALFVSVVLGSAIAQRMILTFESCFESRSLPTREIAASVNDMMHDNGLSSAVDYFSPLALFVAVFFVTVVGQVRTMGLVSKPQRAWIVIVLVLLYYPLIIRPCAVGFDPPALIFSLAVLGVYAKLVWGVSLPRFRRPGKSPTSA